MAFSTEIPESRDDHGYKGEERSPSAEEYEELQRDFDSLLKGDLSYGIRRNIQAVQVAQDVAKPSDESMKATESKSTAEVAPKISVEDFKMMRYSSENAGEMLKMVSDTESSELAVGKKVTFDFHGNAAMLAQVGAGDVMPDKVRVLEKRGVEYTRRANQGFYDKQGRYLAIGNGTEVLVKRIEDTYKLPEHNEWFAVAGGEDREELAFGAYTRLDLLNVAKNYDVDPALLSSVAADWKTKYSNTYEKLEMAARYIQNAEVKYEAGGKTARVGQRYSREFVSYALARFNLWAKFDGLPAGARGIAEKYGKARQADMTLANPVQRDAVEKKKDGVSGLKEIKTSELPEDKEVSGAKGVFETVSAQESPTRQKIYLGYSKDEKLKAKLPHYIVYFSGNKRNLASTLEQTRMQDKVEAMWKAGINAVLVMPAPKQDIEDGKASERWGYLNAGAFAGRSAFPEIESFVQTKTGMSGGKWNVIAWSGGYQGVDRLLPGIGNGKLGSVTMLDATYSSSVIAKLEKLVGAGVKVNVLTQGGGVSAKNTDPLARQLSSRVGNSVNFSYRFFGTDVSHKGVRDQYLLAAMLEGTDLAPKYTPSEEMEVADVKDFANVILQFREEGEAEHVKLHGCERMADYLTKRMAENLRKKFGLGGDTVPRARDSAVAKRPTEAMRGKKISGLTDEDIDQMQPGQAMFMALPDMPGRKYDLSDKTAKITPKSYTARHWVVYLGKIDGKHMFTDNSSKMESYDLKTLKARFGKKVNDDQYPIGGAVDNRVVMTIHDPFAGELRAQMFEDLSPNRMVAGTEPGGSA